MLKISARYLAVAALGFAFAAPQSSDAASSSEQVAPPNWSHAYVLTPLEHKRLRTYGLKDIEVYLVANAATQSGRDVDDLVQLYLVHPQRSIAMEELNLDFTSLLKVHPEWNTPEWQEAVKRGDPVWIPSQSATQSETTKATQSETTKPKREKTRRSAKPDSRSHNSPSPAYAFQAYPVSPP